MKKTAATAALVVALGLSLAQGFPAKTGSLVSRHFQWADVTQRQGILNLSPSGFTTLEFDSEIEALFIRNMGVVECQNCPADPSDQSGRRRLPPTGGSIVFVTSRNVGDSDIIVQVKGAQLYFKVVVVKAQPSQLAYRVISPPATPTSPVLSPGGLSQNAPTGPLQHWVSAFGKRIRVVMINNSEFSLTLNPAEARMRTAGGQAVQAKVEVVGDTRVGPGQLFQAVFTLDSLPAQSLFLECVIQRRTSQDFKASRAAISGDPEPGFHYPSQDFRVEPDG